MVKTAINLILPIFISVFFVSFINWNFSDTRSDICKHKMYSLSIYLKITRNLVLAYSILTLKCEILAKPRALAKACYPVGKNKSRLCSPNNSLCLRTTLTAFLATGEARSGRTPWTSGGSCKGCSWRDCPRSPYFWYKTRLRTNVQLWFGNNFYIDPTDPQIRVGNPSFFYPNRIHDFFFFFSFYSLFQNIASISLRFLCPAQNIFIYMCSNSQLDDD